MTIRQSTRVLPFRWLGQFDAIGSLEEVAWDPLTDEGDGRDVVPHLVDGQNAVADHVCFR